MNDTTALYRPHASRNSKIGQNKYSIYMPKFVAPKSLMQLAIFFPSYRLLL